MGLYLVRCGQATTCAASLFDAAVLDTLRCGQAEEPAEAKINPPPAAIALHQMIPATAAVTNPRRTALLAQELRIVPQKNVGILTGTSSAEPTDPAINLPLQHRNTSSHQCDVKTNRSATWPPCSPYRQDAPISKKNNGTRQPWQLRLCRHYPADSQSWPI